MQVPLRLIFVGVGAFLTFGNTAASLSETAPNQSQNPTETNKPNVTSALSQIQSIRNKRFLQAEKGSASQPLSDDGVSSPRASGLSRVAQMAQSSPLPPNQPTPTPTPTLSPSPSPIPETAQPIGPAKPGPAPGYLNPDPNPLQFPTKPEEVRLRGVQPISLQQAIELAERNSLTLQAQRQQLDRSRAALREQQAALFPQLNTQVGLGVSRSTSQDFQERQANRAGVDVSTGANTALSGTVALSYDLFDATRSPTIRAAERQLRSDELQVEVTREQLRLDVTNDYYSLQQQDESVRINQAAVRNSEASLRDTEALERAGLGTRFDVLSAQVQLAQSRQQLTNSIAQQRIARRQLAQRLNIPFTFDLAAADPVQVAGSWNLPLEESIVLALKNRAELEQLLAQREQAEQQRRAALGILAPSVTLNAQYQIAKTFNNDLGVGDGYSLAANVNWRLFDGGAAAARARQAEANRAIAETNFADQRNQVRFAVEQAYAQLRSNLENIDTTTRALGQAQEALRLARLRFQAGVGTQTEVIDSETRLTTAEGDRVNAILGYNLALAQLQRAITNLPVGFVTAAPPTPATPTPVVPPGTGTQTAPTNPTAPTSPTNSTTPNSSTAPATPTKSVKSSNR